MRTTVEFEADVASAIEAARRERGSGTSQIVNDLIRRGLMAHPTDSNFHQRTAPLGLRLDVSNIADALETLDGPTAR